MQSPIDKRDLSDPGDDVLRRFRYQHAYGVILSVGMVTERIDCKALWCEQHEDFLLELSDGSFDACQVKTRKPELGEWEINDDAFCKSIERFVRLDLAYPNKIRFFYFVSNTQFSNSAAKDRAYLSPRKLLDGIKIVTKSEDLTGDVKKGFECLKVKLGIAQNDLFNVLLRLDIILGPTDRAFEDELAQRHIPTLTECKSLNAQSLGRVREALISRIALASALISDDPGRDWYGLTNKENKDPYLLAKRIIAEDIILTIRDVCDYGFSFLQELASIKLGSANSRLDILNQKMIRGGLSLHYETMRRRALSAERILLDLATRPSDGEKICSQIENVVLSECDDANLRASQTSLPFGSAMLIDVQDRLRWMSENDSARVHRQPYDLLVGVAGLLSSECKVWWSEQFELEVKP